VLKYADSIGYTSSATILGKRRLDTFKAEWLTKVTLDPALLFDTRHWHIKPISIWFKIQRKLFATDEKSNQKRQCKKKIFYSSFFQPVRNFLKLFLLVSGVNLF
jgi:hypothetical protein